MPRERAAWSPSASIPPRPKTGFGYIRAPAATACRPVREFREKPDRATAEAFVASGEYYWNSGMFVWRASRILAAIEEFVPELRRVLAAMRDEAAKTGDLATAIRTTSRRRLRSRSTTACSRNAETSTWCRETSAGPTSAAGTRSTRWPTRTRSNNAVQGNVVQIDCSDSLFRSEGRLIAAVGVEDIAVVETADAILVSRMGQSQQVRKIVDELVRRQGSQHIEHLTVRRPWGTYTVLEEGPGYKIKHIEVRPGGRLSLQSHRFRSEHWVVVSGVATVTRDGERFTVAPNESTFIPVGHEAPAGERGRRAAADHRGAGGHECRRERHRAV